MRHKAVYRVCVLVRTPVLVRTSHGRGDDAAGDATMGCSAVAEVVGSSAEMMVDDDPAGSTSFASDMVAERETR